MLSATFATSATPALAQGSPTNAADCATAGGTWGYNGSSLSCIITPKKVSIALTPLEQAQSFAYYKALRTCLSTGFFKASGAFRENYFEPEDATSFDWFNGRRGVTVNGINIGAMNDPRGISGTGEQNCGDTEGRAWIQKAMSLWGYNASTIPSFLCFQLGFTRDSTEVTCTDMTPGVENSFHAPSNVVDKFDTFWRDSLGYSSVGISSIMSNGGAYLLYLNNFLTQCRPSASSGNTYKIMLYDPTKTEPWYSETYGAPDTSRPPSYGVTVWDQKTMTCQELANAIDSQDDDDAIKGYMQWIVDHPGQSGDTSGSEVCALTNSCAVNTSGTSCPVEGVGWLVCPLLNAIGGLSDAMFSWISGILTLEPLTVTNANGSLQFTAWNSMRNVANVALVIAFIIIIFSQMTGVGVTNYGVKKTLPRLIVVAVLINISFYVMALAIDVTNILGTSLGTVFSSLAPKMNATDFDIENIVSSLLTGGTAIVAGVGIAMVATGGIPLSALALMALPVIATAALGLFAAFATLFIRNALIVILVIISPLAIAAYLLPNTQSLFTRWRKLFISMLVLFPMAAVLFGGAKFAAYISLQSTQPLSALVAVFIMAAPLGMLPFLIKSSNSLLSNLGGKLGNMANSARNPLRKAMQGRVENQQARYKANERNLLGRRVKPGSKTFGARMNNRRMSREQDTKNLQGKATENWRESGVDPTGGRAGQRASQVLDASETLSTRKGMNDKTYTARSDVRKNTAGTDDNRFNAHAEDMAIVSEAHRGEVEQARSQRILTDAGPGGLGELDSRARAAKVRTTSNDTQTKARFDQHVENDATLTGAVQATMGAQQISQTIDKEQQATFATQNRNEELAYREELAGNELKVAHASEQARYQETLSTSQEISAGNPLAGEIARARVADKENAIATARSGAATRVLGQERATELQQETIDPITGVVSPSGLASRMGGIDPNGANLVIAQAIESERKTYDSGVAAYQVRMKQQGLSDGASAAKYDPVTGILSESAKMDTPGTQSLAGIATDATRSAEEREAAGRAIVDGGNIDSIKPYMGYLASSLETSHTAVDTANERITQLHEEAADAGVDVDPVQLESAEADLQNATDQLTTIVSLQKSFGERISSSPGKPMGVGAGEVAMLRTGGYTTPAVSTSIPTPVDTSSFSVDQIQTVNTIAQKGVSVDGWVGMDKSDIGSIIDLAQKGALPPERLSSMWDSIDTALSDPRKYTAIKDREQQLLGQLIDLLPPARDEKTGKEKPRTPRGRTKS
jgi:hypothetical protein